MTTMTTMTMHYAGSLLNQVRLFVADQARDNEAYEKLASCWGDKEYTKLIGKSRSLKAVLVKLEALTISNKILNTPNPTPLQPNLRLSPTALKELINLTCYGLGELFAIEYTDCYITLLTDRSVKDLTKDCNKLRQVLDLLGYEVFCHSGNRDILITLYNIHI